MQAQEQVQRGNQVSYILTPRTLAKLHAVGVDSCRQCGTKFLEGMNVVGKHRVGSPKYCGACAKELHLI